jgi:hypothetical protein
MLPARSMVAVLVLAACGGRPAPRGPQWYEGGNLHRASLREWAAASDANRLATAADFAANIFKSRNLSIDELRPKASDLVEAIRPSAEKPELADLQVSEVAASAAVLMGWR